MRKDVVKEPINVLFVNDAENPFSLLKHRLEDTGVKTRVEKVASEGFEEMVKNDGLGGFEIIIFHLTLGEDFCAEDINETWRYFSDVRNKHPHIRLGIMSGAYDYDCLGNELDLGPLFPRNLVYKIKTINGVVLELKPDFYCSYTDDSFVDFVAKQIAKGWLREKEITWRNEISLNILTPRAEFGPHGRIERE